MPGQTEDTRITACQVRDIHLADQALAELHSLPYSGLRNVCCRVDDQVIVLSGCVPTFYQKQLAQEKLRLYLGADIAIQNDLQVGDPR